MADYNQCLANAQKVDPQATLCDQWVCENNSNYVHKFCHCQPPNPPQNPCPWSANTPVPVYDKSGNICYCCCSCFAWGTPIAVPDGEPKAIQTFVRGDSVLAAGANLEWTPYAVEFSDGIPPSPEWGKTMFSVYFQTDGGVGSLVVTADHVFLLSDGKLRRAHLLVPGKDALTTADGKPAPVLSIEAGGWYGGVHHIGTSDKPATSVDGHLLNSKGIVSGDWALQIADIEGGQVEGAQMEDAAGPVAATMEFVAANSHLVGDMFTHAVESAEWEHARHRHFRPYSSQQSGVPQSAMRFISEQQAEDVLKNGKQAPVTSIAGQDIVSYLFRLFQGFYPDVKFRLEWGEPMPNAYSWFSYGVPFVVLNGGLVRTQGVDYTTLAVILAHELGHLYGGDPKTGDGLYSCEGQADYAGIIGVLRATYWRDNYYSVASSGIDGVERFFDLIDPDNRKGVPGQTCDGLSTDCRLRSMRAALQTLNLPECAGGPVVSFLQVTSAFAKMAEGAESATVTVNFSAALDAASALHAANYGFAPAAEIAAVAPDPTHPDSVLIDAKLLDKQDYQLTVENILSSTGATLPGGSATIEVTWA